MLFGEHFDRAAAEVQAGKPFLLVGGRSTAYGDFLDGVKRTIALFSAKGISPGDRIALLTTDLVELSTLLLAALRSGVAVVSLNVEMNPAERRHALNAAAVSHVFIDRALLDAAPLPPEMARTVIEAASGGRGGLIGRLLKSKKKAASDQPPSGLVAERAAQDPAALPPVPPAETTGLMLFTSGTTSAPKVVRLSHRNLAAQVETFAKVYDYDGDSRILNVLPPHFTDGLLHGPIIAFLSGATYVRPMAFTVQDLGEILHGIYRDRITHFIVVPAILSIMDRLHGEFDEAFKTPDFRYIRSSGDRLPEALWRSVQERFGVRVINTYGLSETVCEAVYCGPSEETFRLGSIGKPIDCEVKITDDDGRELARGESGSLWIKGDNIMEGYLNQPELTAEVLHDGWFNTGDLAKVDADGFVWIVGRKKTLIISGGTNIQPQDITDALLDHPDVADAITLGLPDPLWGEVVASAVVAKDPATPPTTQALLDHCRSKLAPHKIPRVLTLLDSLPRNPAGKVLLDEVKAQVEGGAQAKELRADASLEDKILVLAAAVFRCEPEDLRMTSESRATPGWDSLAHIRLMAEAETAFGVKLAPRDILGITRLEHLKEAIARHLDGAAE